MFSRFSVFLTTILGKTPNIQSCMCIYTHVHTDYRVECPKLNVSPAEAKSMLTTSYDLETPTLLIQPNNSSSNYYSLQRTTCHTFFLIGTTANFRIPILKNIYLFLAALGLSCSARASLQLWHVGPRARRPCSCSMQAFQLWQVGLVALWNVRSQFPYQGSIPCPCIGRQILNHWTTREVPGFPLFFNFIYFLAALGLRCCAWAFSSCSKWGLLFVALHGLLIAVASLVAEHGLQASGLQQLQHTVSVVVARGLSSYGARAQLLQGMWYLPGPGLEPVSPALAGRFLTTAPPGKSQDSHFKDEKN